MYLLDRTTQEKSPECQFVDLPIGCVSTKRMFEILAKIKIFVSQSQFCLFVDTLPRNIPNKLQDFCLGGSLRKVHIEAVFGHRNFKYSASAQCKFTGNSRFSKIIIRARNNMSDAVLCIFSGSNNKIFQNDLT